MKSEDLFRRGSDLRLLDKYLRLHIFQRGLRQAGNLQIPFRVLLKVGLTIFCLVAISRNQPIDSAFVNDDNFFIRRKTLEEFLQAGAFL